MTVAAGDHLVERHAEVQELRYTFAKSMPPVVRDSVFQSGEIVVGQEALLHHALGNVPADVSVASLAMSNQTPRRRAASTRAKRRPLRR